MATGAPPSEAQADSVLIEAESSFEAGLIDAARNLYREASSLFTRLMDMAPNEAKLALYMVKASYCDFMMAYCEAIDLKKRLDEAVMKGQEASPEDVSRLKLLARIADRYLKEAVLRLERLRSSTDDEAIREAVGEVIRMIGKKVEAFVEFRDEVEVL